MAYLNRLHLDASTASQILALNELYEAAEQAGYLRGLRSAVGSLEHAELASIVEERARALQFGAGQCDAGAEV